MAANPYQAMANAKVNDNFTINTDQYIYVAKSELQEHQIMETGDLNQPEETTYFDGNADPKASEEDDFDPDISSLIRIKQEWAEPTQDRNLKKEGAVDYGPELFDAEEEEIVEEEYEYEEAVESEEVQPEQIKAEVGQVPVEPTAEEQESDEETIATFLTASGKQLALYAVEDSDDVFAVAAYDGSGNPPSQFQFLMKADVERLIGQGAVKTIKKPSSIKQQMYLGDTSTILRNNRLLKEDTDVPSPTYEQHRSNDDLQESSSRNIKCERDEDLSYQLMESQDSFDVTGRASLESVESGSSMSRSESMSKSAGDVITVQNLLFHEEESESELTFDDIKSIDFNVTSDKSVNNQKLDKVKPSFIKSESSMEIGSVSKSSSMEVRSNSSGIKMDIGCSDKSKTASMKSNYKMDIGSKSNSMDTFKSISDLMDTRSNSLNSMSSRTYSLELGSNSVGNRPSFMEVDSNSMDNPMEDSDSMDMGATDNSLMDDSNLMDVDNSVGRSNSNVGLKSMEVGFNAKSRSILRRTYQVVKPQQLEGMTQVLDPGSASPQSPEKGKTKQTKRAKHMPRALLGCKTNTFDSRTSTVFIHGSTALICCPIQPVKKAKDKEAAGTEENGEREKIEEEKDKEKEEKDKTVCKLKRPPRKQQLKINDRADSEIIIQPAVMEEETFEEVASPVRKRGRRKKIRADGKVREDEKKGKDGKSRRGRKKKSRIEVIDLDQEEVAARHIEEITIDEHKEKGSSDKENEIIMLESEEEAAGEEEEEEEQEEEEPWKCKFCRRGFRQKRAMDTHTRMCPKSPRRLELKGAKEVKEKKYVCKICKETFDVVVALARHTRSHYKKTVVEEPEEEEEEAEEEEEEEEEIIEEVEMLVEEIEESEEKEEKKAEVKKRKRRVGSFHMKLRCLECRKWFSSMSLLATHYLKHDTKNTDLQMKYCYICRKLIKNKLQYLRHMQLHVTSPKKSSKNSNSIPKSNSKLKLNSHKEASPVQAKKTKSPVRRSTRSSTNTSSTSKSTQSTNKKSEEKSLDKKVNSKKLSVRKSNRQKKL